MHSARAGSAMTLRTVANTVKRGCDPQTVSTSFRRDSAGALRRFRIDTRFPLLLHERSFLSGVDPNSRGWALSCEKEPSLGASNVRFMHAVLPLRSMLDFDMYLSPWALDHPERFPPASLVTLRAQHDMCATTQVRHLLYQTDAEGLNFLMHSVACRACQPAPVRGM